MGGMAVPARRFSLSVKKRAELQDPSLEDVHRLELAK
jgi:hypothetical protein